MNADKVNDAIRECLEHCKGTHNPHHIAASFVAGLRRRPEWTNEEVDQVTAALSVLLPRQSPSNS